MTGLKHNDNLVEEQYKNATNLDIRAFLHQNYSTNKMGFVNWMHQQIQLFENCKILELGCGAGGFWPQEYTESLQYNIDISLSDISLGMLETAKERVKIANAKFLQIDVEAIPFENNTFDLVIANHMIYHVPNIDKALGEIKRVLKADGKFFASTNGISNMDDLANLVSVYNPEIKYPSSGELTKFSLENGKEFLEKHFNSIELRRYPDSLEIDKSQDLTNYVISLKEWGNIGEKLVGEAIDNFNQYIDDLIKSQGKIIIKKDSGVFISVK